ncbi:MAG: cobalamin biosynthesis protein, partial [Acidimicrobiales bacterium]|nr:cobalamin biosynthesis protein [Acidimicrobiales bacterium]
MSVVLVVGGTKSGKSHFSERLLAGYSRVGYFATAPSSWADEAKFQERIKAHRASRSASFDTVEVGDNPEDLPALLERFKYPALVDSVGTWISALYEKNLGRDFQ